MKDNGDKRGQPAAGCMNCGSSAWVLALDDFPPNHTKIIALVCSGYSPDKDQRVLCGYHMRVNIPIATMQDMSDREEVVDNPDEDV